MMGAALLGLLIICVGLPILYCVEHDIIFNVREIVSPEEAEARRKWGARQRIRRAGGAAAEAQAAKEREIEAGTATDPELIELQAKW